MLSLSLIFCVGFGSSLTASAANNNFSNFYNQVFPYNLNAALYLNGGRVLEDSFDNENRFYAFYNFATSPVTTSSLHNRIIPDGWDITFLFEEYDYYLAFTCVGDAGQIENFTYYPNRLAIQNHSTSHDGSLQTFDCINTTFYHHDTANEFGFTAIGQVPVLPNNFIFSVNTYGSSGTVPKDLRTSITVFQVPKSDGSDISQVISAIRDQTSDLQQSINDQYGGDPGSSFPVDDIITQHNEKMGVLSFGSDTLMQVLGLLSPDQSLSSELVFPSMSLTVAGQRNKVQLWPEYRFDLNELKQHWPDFIRLMQSLTTALVWIFVLRYCYRVFEKYFLAGGGN